MWGNTLDALTLNLFYATDFWDRLEKNIVPALRTGMVALVDRYIFSIIARARVRGVPARWLNDVFEFAVVPDRVLYLDVDVDHLLPRVLAVRQLDHWESGEDFMRGPDLHDNFIRYQSALLNEFRDLAKEHNFVTIDARGGVGDVFQALQTEVREALEGMDGL
jgi:dTMP kinase